MLDPTIEALARQILADPELVALREPNALIVRLAARVIELRHQLDGVTHDCQVAEHHVGRLRAERSNLLADRDRLQDAAARLVPADPAALLALVELQH
ncbi:hypothetical protein ACWDOP_00245 [Nocardia sp. NPDC003693]